MRRGRKTEQWRRLYTDISITKTHAFVGAKSQGRPWNTYVSRERERELLLHWYDLKFESLGYIFVVGHQSSFRLFVRNSPVSLSPIILSFERVESCRILIESRRMRLVLPSTLAARIFGNTRIPRIRVYIYINANATANVFTSRIFVRPSIHYRNVLISLEINLIPTNRLLSFYGFVPTLHHRFSCSEETNFSANRIK